jgi:hypothetical protein
MWFFLALLTIATAQSPPEGLVWIYDSPNCNTTSCQRTLPFNEASTLVPLDTCLTNSHSAPFYCLQAAWNMPRAKCLTCVLNVYAAASCAGNPHVIDTLHTTPSACVAFDKGMYAEKAVGFVSLRFTCVLKAHVESCQGMDVTY